MSASLVQPSPRLLQFPTRLRDLSQRRLQRGHGREDSGDLRIVRLPARRWMRLVERQQAGGRRHV